MSELTQEEYLQKRQKVGVEFGTLKALDDCMVDDFMEQYIFEVNRLVQKYIDSHVHVCEGHIIRDSLRTTIDYEHGYYDSVEVLFRLNGDVWETYETVNSRIKSSKRAKAAAAENKKRQQKEKEDAALKLLESKGYIVTKT